MNELSSTSRPTSSSDPRLLLPYPQVSDPNDPSTAEIVASLSRPAPADARSLSRRRFIQAAAASGALASVPTWAMVNRSDVAGAAAGASVGADEGIVVMMTMGGGNDALNTVIPIGDPTYYDNRPRLGISAADSLQITDNYGLHPNLPSLKQRYDMGQVAVIEGVGQPVDDLSHFTSMARWMSGRMNGVPTSGWMGRHLDGLNSDIPIPGVSIGSSVPLLMLGSKPRTSALPEKVSGLFAVRSDAVDQRQYAALREFVGNTGLGQWGDALAASGGAALDLASELRPIYPSDPVTGKVARQMEVIARLINAGIGVRVFSVIWGSFDSHSGQVQQHGDRMAEFDAAIRVFYETLNPQWADRVLVVTQSEFGRRAKDHNSDGTDHGAGGTMLAIGSNVNGGFYGQAPSLTNLTRQDNLVPTVDFRHVQSTVLNDWMAGDAGEIFGTNFESMGFLNAPGTAPVEGEPTGPIIINTTERRNSFVRLYLAYFLRFPDAEGIEYWLTVGNGQLGLGEASLYFADSQEFNNRYGSVDDGEFVDLIYGNVLNRIRDTAGYDYWIQVLADGYSRGEVMIWFSESEENIMVTASRVAEYNALTAGG